MKMLACYGLRDEAMHLETNKIQQVLVFDALFLAIYIEGNSSSIDFAPGDRRMWTREHIRMSDEAVKNFFSTFGAWTLRIHYDLCRIENQVPFDLIKKAIKHIQGRRNLQNEHEGHPDLRHDACDVGGQEPDPYLETWMKRVVWAIMNVFMDTFDDFYKTEKEEPRLSESHHILDAAHKAICGVSGMGRASDDSEWDYISVPSARRLTNSGIKIQGVGGPLCTMSYNKHTKCLSLPKMKILGDTVIFVRNMVQYEESLGMKRCMFHDYIFLMHDLVQTPEDLTILSDEGVIQVSCSPSKGFEFWKAVGPGLGLVFSSKEHNQMKNDINTRCNLRAPDFGTSSKLSSSPDLG